MLLELRPLLEADKKRFLVHYFNGADELTGTDVIVVGDGGVHSVDGGNNLFHTPVKVDNEWLFQL